MEHRIFQGGGEQYLPFARSRANAMRAAGLKYASQRYTFSDGEAEIRIVGPHTYIRLSGGSTLFISGASRVGTIVDSKLHEFHLDLSSWKSIYKNAADMNPYDPILSDGIWYDEPRLAVQAHADLGVSGTQYEDVCSSMYSGLMAKAAQAALGYLKDGKTAVQIRYNYRAAITHGVVRDAINQFWLVEISTTNGVIAMKLPMDKIQTPAGQDSALDFVRTVFGGNIPNGSAFPTDISAGVAAGTIKRLASVDAMAPYFTKSMYSDTLGWSFNEDGSEAHNTCYDTDGTNYTGYHYKLELNPLNGFATLTEVSSGDLHGLSRFMFWDGDAQIFRETPTRAWAGGAQPAEEQQTTLFVYHEGNTLRKVYHYSCNGRTTGYTWNDGIRFSSHPFGGTAFSYGFNNAFAENPDYFQWREYITSIDKESYITSDTIEGFAGGYRERLDVGAPSTVGSFLVYAYLGDPNPITYEILERSESYYEGTWYSSAGLWPDGTRDGYVFRNKGIANAVYGSYTNHSWKFNSPNYNDAGIDRTYVSTTTTLLPDGTTDYVYGRFTDASSVWGGSTGGTGSGEYDEIRVLNPTDTSLAYFPNYVDSTEHDTYNDLWSNTGSIFNLRCSMLNNGGINDNPNNYVVSSINIGGTDSVDVSPVFYFFLDTWPGDYGIYDSSRISFVGVTGDIE